jgi:hypothetical protein
MKLSQNQRRKESGEDEQPFSWYGFNGIKQILIGEY